MGLIADVIQNILIHWFAVGGEAVRRRHYMKRALSQSAWVSSGILEALVAADPYLYYNARQARNSYKQAAQVIAEEVDAVTPLTVPAVKTIVYRALESTSDCAIESARVDELSEEIVRALGQGIRA